MAKVNIIIIIWALMREYFQLTRVILKKIVTRIGEIMGNSGSRNFGEHFKSWLSGQIGGSEGLLRCIFWYQILFRRVRKFFESVVITFLEIFLYII